MSENFSDLYGYYLPDKVSKWRELDFSGTIEWRSSSRACFNLLFTNAVMRQDAIKYIDAARAMLRAIPENSNHIILVKPSDSSNTKLNIISGILTEFPKW